MTSSYANYPQTRGDFRCAICRQKNVFHCEHETPYRDQYLSTYDPNISQNYVRNNRSSNSKNRKFNNSISNGKINTEQRVNSNTGVEHQQDKTIRTNHNRNGSSKIYEQNKKSKSCVIL